MRSVMKVLGVSSLKFRARCRSAGAWERRDATSRTLYSTLDGAGEGGDVVLDEKRVDEGDGDGAEQRACHERPPVEDVAPHQLGEDPDGDRLLLRRREEDEGVEELVP